MFVQHRRDTSKQSIIEAVDHSAEIIRRNDCRTEHALSALRDHLDRREAGKQFCYGPIFGDGSLRKAMTGSGAFLARAIQS
jgi:hypothetical protein